MSMDFVIYFAMLLPAAIMILAGLIVGSIRQENTMKSHHFATDFNIRRYTGSVMALFTVCGLLFSLSGIIIMKLSIVAGYVLFAAVTVVFAIVYSSILKRG